MHDEPNLREQAQRHAQSEGLKRAVPPQPTDRRWRDGGGDKRARGPGVVTIRPEAHRLRRLIQNSRGQESDDRDHDQAHRNGGQFEAEPADQRDPQGGENHPANAGAVISGR